LHNEITEDEWKMPDNFRYISNGDLFQSKHEANMIQ
jgi:hypothetical protein